MADSGLLVVMGAGEGGGLGGGSAPDNKLQTLTSYKTLREP